jgi:DNA polymerase III subunit alpha
MSKILFFDTETTGLPTTKGWGNYYNPSYTSYYNDSRIIEIAYIIYDVDKNIVKSVDYLIQPDGFEINNSKFHGITMDDAIEHGKELSYVLNELESDLDDIGTIVAHNIKFDINILLSECYRLKKIDMVKKIGIIDRECTMEIGKSYIKSRKYPKLVELYQHIFGKTIEQKHRALSDTQICAQCYYQMNP